jgi:hypothetical protein
MEGLPLTCQSIPLGYFDKAVDRVSKQPPGVPSADIAPPGGDGIVDMNDLGLLVDNWLWGK